MRYGDNDRESTNVEDRRGQRRGGFRFPGGGGFPFPGRGRQMRIPMGGRRGGFSITTLIIIGVVMMLLGFNPLDLLRGGATGPGGGSIDMSRVPQMPGIDANRTGAQRSPFDLPGTPGGSSVPTNTATSDELGRRVKQVLADTEDFWTKEFARHNLRYRPATLVLFTGATQTACGQGSAQMGPFYCPLDKKVYIDLGFYDELRQRFRAPGDFAQAYVIAHEVGHHIQTILGIADQVQQLKRASPRDANGIQVRMELQADCLAGMWARGIEQSKQRLEEGDIEEGLNAASAIGDDMIQRQTTGRVSPESFTHGSSKQRMRWFSIGYQQGSMAACDTFRSQNL